MANTFPAAIANEPPPLDVSSDDEDSEEFRSHGLKLDVPSGEPTPVSTPFKLPFKKIPENNKMVESDKTSEELILATTPEGSCSISNEASPCDENESIPTNTDESEEVKLNGIDDDSSGNKTETEVLIQANNNDDMSEQFSVKNIQIEKSTNLCDTNIVKIPESDTPESLQSCNDATSVTSLVIANSTEKYDSKCDSDFLYETSDEIESKCQVSNIGDIDASLSPLALEELAKENDEDFQIIQTTCETSSIADEENSRPNIDEIETNDILFRPSDGNDGDFEDDDFGAFQSIPNPAVQQDSSLAQKELDNDDDFGDFAHSSVQAPQNKIDTMPSIQKTSLITHEVIEDFADFQDCPFQSCDGPSKFKPPAPSTPSDLTLISSKIDSIVKSLFVTDVNSAEGEENPNSIDCEISTSSDSTWTRVQDFEGSHGLMFKWLSSLTGKRFLRSLNINTNNIVYHEKWGNIEVPKFAASLIQSPLQPQSCNKLESQAKSDEHPAIVNNNTIISDDHTFRDHFYDNNIFYKPPTISVEAQEILRQLPDLSYMRANTLVFPPSSPSGL